MILNFATLTAMRDANNLRSDSQEKTDIQTLLDHIQSVHDHTNLRYRTAYEVFRIGQGGVYRNRVVEGVFWKKGKADRFIEENKETNRGRDGYLRTSIIHLIKIDGLWFRVYTSPYRNVQGAEAEAGISHLDPNEPKPTKKDKSCTTDSDAPAL